jgi:hypothetical protein
MKSAELLRRTQKFARTEKTGREPVGGIRQLHKVCRKQINPSTIGGDATTPIGGGLRDSATIKGDST